ncbi:hypothetical protein SIID45300_01131 [Candidatus Magnetaquicoccaceae bacterium FCR-1]|uniref:AAA+ ATPase domain-containing protein n=1 Tax=Candidatus Magnetaquiglobus chichijimensis TaxID=3141448 RepID=A0ABQ0C7F8_9PROT
MTPDMPSDIATFLATAPIAPRTRRLLTAAPLENPAPEPHPDGGMARFRKAIRALPDPDGRHQPDSSWLELHHGYVEQLRQPLFPVHQRPRNQEPTLTPPSLVTAFLPPAYRAVVHTHDQRHYDDPTFWDSIELRQDLGHLLLAWLLSDQSALTPLVIIGPTGSGKTHLTRILAGHLSASLFHPVRLVLGSVDAQATIQGQIEEQLRQDLGRKIEWGPLSRSARARHPVVLLDGMNELLGADERVFRDYPEKARRFQELESSLGRPVRLILTSRTEVIDRADLPDGAMVLRLEPFDAMRRDRWIRLWNRANRDYFRASGVEPLRPPDNPALRQLAEIPFHLALMAVLDADGNPLHACDALTSFELHQRIVQRFVARTLPSGCPDERLHQEQKRLGAVAVGMFHRRALSIRADEIAADAPFFPQEADTGSSPSEVLPLPQLLEQLFFVHVERRDKRSRPGALGRGKEPPNHGYAFWHATFGEFLTADCLLRLTRDEAQRICRERRGRNRATRKLAEERFRDPMTTPEAWMAPLIHTPLIDRPGILAMLRERAKGCWLMDKGERGAGLDRENFLVVVDEMIQGQLHWILHGHTLPPLMTDGRLPWSPRPPLLGYLAIYALNLIILRSLLDPEGWIFDEGMHGIEGGVPAWERLNHVWRAWFTDEHLDHLHDFLEIRRHEGRVRIQAHPRFSRARRVVCSGTQSDPETGGT